jgi:hypothetical protein
MSSNLGRAWSAPAFPATLVALALAIGACDAPPPTALSPDDAPELAAQAAGDVIPGRFIVTVRPDASPSAVAARHDVTPDFVYTHALNGFAGEMSSAARQGLLADARVVRVEPDRRMWAWGTQQNATWGLDRIDQRQLPLDGAYTMARRAPG